MISREFFLKSYISNASKGYSDVCEAIEEKYMNNHMSLIVNSAILNREIAFVENSYLFRTMIYCKIFYSAYNSHLYCMELLGKYQNAFWIFPVSVMMLGLSANIHNAKLAKEFLITNHYSEKKDIANLALIGGYHCGNNDLVGLAKSFGAGCKNGFTTSRRWANQCWIRAMKKLDRFQIDDFLIVIGLATIGSGPKPKKPRRIILNKQE